MEKTTLTRDDLEAMLELTLDARAQATSALAILKLDPASNITNDDVDAYYALAETFSKTLLDTLSEEFGL